MKRHVVPVLLLIVIFPVSVILGAFGVSDAAGEDPAGGDSSQEDTISYGKTGMKVIVTDADFKDVLSRMEAELENYFGYDHEILADGIEDRTISVRIEIATPYEALKKIARKIPNGTYRVDSDQERLKKGGEVKITRRYRFVRLSAEELKDIDARSGKLMAEVRKLYEEGEYFKAAQKVEIADDINPYSDEIRIFKARLFLKRNSPRGTFNALKGIAEETKDCDVHTLLAQAYLKMFDIDAALARYRQAAEYCADQDAVEQVRRAVRSIEANIGNGHYELVRKAREYVMAQNLSEAEKALEEAVRKSPDEILALQSLFQVYVARQDLEKAAGIAGEMERIDGENPGYYAILAKLHMQLKEYEKSRYYIDKALERTNQEWRIRNLKKLKAELEEASGRQDDSLKGR